MIQLAGLFLVARFADHATPADKLPVPEEFVGVGRRHEDTIHWSAIFETGGFKGRKIEVTHEELLGRVQDWLGVPAGAIVREYGMTELTSQCYTGALLGEDPDLFVSPHWVRVRILDPETLEEVPAGTPGLISVFDLANLGSAGHLLTKRSESSPSSAPV